MLQPIDKKLVEKIQMLVGEGVRNVDEMKRHLRHFVKNDLFDGQILPSVTTYISNIFNEHSFFFLFRLVMYDI